MAKADEADEEAAGTRRDRITIDPSPAMRRYLNQLVRLGIYGKTPTTVARRLIDEGVRLALKEGLVEKEREDD